MRSGLIAKKLGMSRVFLDDGSHVPVTVLEIEGCQVLGQMTEDKNGYTALQLGAGRRKPKHTTRPQREKFARVNVEPKRKIAEFRVSPENLIDVGAELTADHFLAGQFVDVTAKSQGKGFTGAMRRWNFGGMRASHGVSISHRAHGSTGQCQDPGKVFKGKKMAGHYGAERVTTQNLEVVRVDADRGLVLVKGAVPGSKGNWVMIRDAIKRPLPKDAPMPGAFKPPVAAGAGEAASEE